MFSTCTTANTFIISKLIKVYCIKIVPTTDVVYIELTAS